MNGIDHFDKFIPSARKVIELAQEEALHFQHDALGSEHILLGLIREGNSASARVLYDLGITLEKVRRAVEETKGRGSKAGPAEMGLTPQATIVIEMAMRKAERQFPRRAVKPGERLLGSIDLEEQAAEEILHESKVPPHLAEIGITLEQIRKAREESKGRGVHLLFDQKAPINTPTERAERRRHQFFRITPEHLLIGLLRVSESLAARLLQALGAPSLKDVGSLLSLEQMSTWQTLNQGYTQQFTRQARNAWMLAHEESRRLQDSFVGVSHLLLGLVAQGSGVAATALAEMGVGLAQLREKVTPSHQAGDWKTPGSITLQPRMREVIELASNEARRLNHHAIGTGHLLLALIREDGMVSSLLEALKVDLNSLRRTLREAPDEESVQHVQDDEALADLVDEEGVYTYDASLASLERDLRSRELDKTILAAYPFTLESWTVLAKAQIPATNRGRRVGPEDVLLGLAGLTKSDGLVSKVLKDLGIDNARISEAVEKRQEQEKQTPSVVRVQSALCKAYLLFAVDEAEQRDGRGAPIKSEHLLLGLLREEQGSIADVLLDIGTSVREVRTKLLEAMGDSRSEGTSHAGN